LHILNIKNHYGHILEILMEIRGWDYNYVEKCTDINKGHLYRIFNGEIKSMSAFTEQAIKEFLITGEKTKYSVLDRKKFNTCPGCRKIFKRVDLKRTRSGRGRVCAKCKKHYDKAWSDGLSEKRREKLSRYASDLSLKKFYGDFWVTRRLTIELNKEMKNGKEKEKRPNSRRTSRHPLGDSKRSKKR